MAGTRYKKRTRKDAEDWLLQNWQSLILLFFLCAGLVIGAVLIRDGAVSAAKDGEFHLFLSDFLPNRQGAAFGTRFVAAFSGCILFYLATVLLSLSMPGIFLIPFLTLFRGMGVGLLVAFFYQSGGLTGIAYTILILLPHLLLSTWVLLSSSGSGIRLSLNISRQFLSKEPLAEVGAPVFRKFLLKQASLLLFLALSALLDACLGLCFDRFFHFEGVL